MLTGRIAVLIGIGAIVTLLTGNAWVALLPLTVAVLGVAVDLALAGSLRDVTLARDGDRQTRLGEPTTVGLTITNNGVRPLVADVRDIWVPSAGATGDEGPIRLEPGTATRLVTTLDPSRRGDRPAVRVSLRSHGPLRLAYRQTTLKRSEQITPPWTVRVLPRFDSRRFLAEKVGELRVLDGATVTRGRGQGTEFDSIREYVVGDDVRSIDWRGTARRSDVVIRTWRPERDRRVVCVIDTGRTSAVRVDSTAVGADALRFRTEPRLDASIDAALLLSELASRAGDRVDVFAVDSAVRTAITGASSRTVLSRTVNALAPLQPALVETDFALLIGEVLRRERKRSLVVLFTALEPGALGEGLLPVLHQLTTRHTVIVAAVEDPEVDILAQRRGTTADVFTAAAAHRTLAERARIVGALGRNGVVVVDAPVPVFASRVADAYLMMKATGRL